MRVYCSHSIRGKYGKDATHVQMQANCDTIIGLVKQLRVIFPTIEFYIPAESEPFVQRASDKHYLTEHQILEIDCMIVDNCDAVIIYVPEGDKLQGGREIEFDYAFDHNIPVYVFSTIAEASGWISSLIIRN